jgi:hypothetical protein
MRCARRCCARRSPCCLPLTAVQEALKRKVAIAKASGKDPVEPLNEYVRIFPADEAAWQELAEVYLSVEK